MFLHVGSKYFTQGLWFYLFFCNCNSFQGKQKIIAVVLIITLKTKRLTMVLMEVLAALTSVLSVVSGSLCFWQIRKRFKSPEKSQHVKTSPDKSRQVKANQDRKGNKQFLKAKLWTWKPTSWTGL
jgi:Na+/H+ antiporter NhaB